MSEQGVLLLARDPVLGQVQRALAPTRWAPRIPTGEVPEWPAFTGCRTGILQLAGLGGHELARAETIVRGARGVNWIALTPPEVVADSEARRFVKSHFFDFQMLPLDSGQLLASLNEAEASAVAGGGFEGAYGMIGQSPVMQSLYRGITKVSASDAPVMIGGESGVGKELVARAIHNHSARSKKPFVAVNCAALPGNLIQSELFGHEKGAFTGAHSSKPGRFEAAQGGTLFLDEIGDLPADLQVNLLRVLQSQVVERVGSHRQIPLDLRVVCATHVDLEAAVVDGRMREDLYYRLNVLRVQVPALRERGEDIEALAQHYFDAIAREYGTRSIGFSGAALRVMASYHWPGNVRELVNRVRRAVVMSENRLLTPEDLGLEKRMVGTAVLTLAQARERAEEEAIRLALRRTHNNVSDAARQLGISRASLYRLLERHKLRGAAGGLADAEI